MEKEERNQKQQETVKKRIADALHLCAINEGRGSMNALRMALLSFLKDSKKIYPDLYKSYNKLDRDSFTKTLKRAAGEEHPYKVSYAEGLFLENLLDVFIRSFNNQKNDASSEAISGNVTAKNQSIINELDTISLTTYCDVGFVELSEWSKKRESISLKDVYVERIFESRIHNIINNSSRNSNIVVISGDAGCGKSSLLWNLHGRYLKNATVYPVFLRSTDILDYNFTNLLLTAGETVTKTILLLIDTIDLLLYDDSSRNAILRFLLKIKESSYICVATTRPQELTTLAPVLNAGKDYELIKVGHYDEQLELPVAIKKYADIYSEADPNKDQAQLLRQAMAIISTRRSVKNLCVNPLTLRMLFTLYAPQRLPKEINVIQLYKKFWHDRVEFDNSGMLSLIPFSGNVILCAKF